MLLLTPLIFLIMTAALAQNPINDSMKPDSDYRPVTGTTSEQSNAALVAARSLLEMGRLSDAEQSVQKYLKAQPESADGHYLLGFILFRRAKTKESLAEYTEGAKYRTPSAFDLKVVACDYVLLRDYMDADKWLTRSIEWNPKDSQAWYYLGRTKYNENRFEEAISAFNECLKLTPNDVKAEDNLGLSYAGLGRKDEAKASYLRAMAWDVESSAKDPGPFIDFGELLIDDNRAEEAISYLLQAVQIGPQDLRVHRDLGKAYLRVNQAQEAERELEKAIGLAPQDPSLHYMLGQAYRKQGQVEKAKLEFDRYAAMNKTDPSQVTPVR